jgi:hypothetical protein
VIGVKSIVQWGAVLGAIVAALAILTQLAKGYRRSLGRRRHAYKRLSRLAVNAQVSVFTDIIGKPPAFSKDFGDSDDPNEWNLREQVYLERDFYVHVVVTANDKVVVFSVTTRKSRFKPKVRFSGRRFIPGVRVKLGSTRFAKVGLQPKRTRCIVRDSLGLYQEWYELEEGAGYQQLVLSINDAGWVSTRWASSMARMVPAPQSLFDTAVRGREPSPRAVKELRRAACPNSYSVMGPGIYLYNDLLRNYLGPRREDVTMLD